MSANIFSFGKPDLPRVILLRTIFERSLYNTIIAIRGAFVILEISFSFLKSCIENAGNKVQIRNK